MNTYKLASESWVGEGGGVEGSWNAGVEEEKK